MADSKKDTKTSAKSSSSNSSSSKSSSSKSTGKPRTASATKSTSKAATVKSGTKPATTKTNPKKTNSAKSTSSNSTSSKTVPAKSESVAPETTSDAQINAKANELTAQDIKRKKINLAITVVIFIAALLGFAAFMKSKSEHTAEVDVHCGAWSEAYSEGEIKDLRNVEDACLWSLLQGNVYQGLVGYDKDGKIQNVLAADYKASDDYKTYNFMLKKKISFSTGDAVTAQDVVYSLYTAKEGDGVYHGDDLYNLESVECSEEGLITIKLAYPDENFINILATPAGTIYQEDQLRIINTYLNEAQNHSFADLLPMGTGPYFLSEFKQGDEENNIVLKSSGNYYAPTDIKFNYKTINVKMTPKPLTETVQEVSKLNNVKIFSSEIDRWFFIDSNIIPDEESK
ncbi:MAG: ABC transporter substrate-binding protein [Bifidobacteriaceae bacterium]|jgi:peptide/nickel transport system substrate-binding protein|nr:ABC transporter substrate-binding protein [Bifidobacteriaceae bacterium]